MLRRSILSASLAGATIAALSVPGCSREPAWRVGFLAGLSGRSAELGNAGLKGAQLAVEQVNAAGGVHGRPVSLLVRDDQQDAAAAAIALQSLVEERAEFVVGPMTSSIALALREPAERARMVLLSPSATSSELSGLDDHFFRIVPALSSIAEAQAAYLVRSGCRRLGLALSAGNPAFTRNWTEHATRRFAADGGKVTLIETFEAGPAMRFTDLAAQLVGSGADCITIVAAGADVALLALALRKRSASMPLVAAPWTDTTALLEQGGAALEGAVVTQYFDPDSAAPAYRRFVADYQARFKEAPGFGGLFAFDAMRVGLEALRARAPRQSLRDTLLGLGQFAGLQGPLSFDRHGDGGAPARLARVVDGRLRIIAP